MNYLEGNSNVLQLPVRLFTVPSLILADEPTGNLDSQNGTEVVTLLRRCSREFGQTVLLATHSEAAALQADRQLALKDGQLL